MGGYDSDGEVPAWEDIYFIEGRQCVPISSSIHPTNIRENVYHSVDWLFLLWKHKMLPSLSCSQSQSQQLRYHLDAPRSIAEKEDFGSAPFPSNSTVYTPHVSENPTEATGMHACRQESLPVRLEEHGKA